MYIILPHFQKTYISTHYNTVPQKNSLAEYNNTIPKNFEAKYLNFFIMNNGDFKNHLVTLESKLSK